MLVKISKVIVDIKMLQIWEKYPEESLKVNIRTVDNPKSRCAYKLKNYHNIDERSAMNNIINWNTSNPRRRIFLLCHIVKELNDGFSCCQRPQRFNNKQTGKLIAAAKKTKERKKESSTMHKTLERTPLSILTTYRKHQFDHLEIGWHFRSDLNSWVCDCL